MTSGFSKFNVFIAGLLRKAVSTARRQGVIPEALNDDLYFNLDRASLLMRRQVLEVLGEYEVSPEQWEILQYLEEQNGINQSRLTLVTLKDKGNVSRIIARMVRDGWVERRTGQSDNRSVALYLTNKGTKIRDRLPTLLRKRTESILMPFAAEERSELLSALKKLRLVLGDKSVMEPVAATSGPVEPSSDIEGPTSSSL